MKPSYQISVAFTVLHRVEDVTLLLVASEAGKLYVFDLQSLDAGRYCALLNEFQLCSPADMSV